MDARRVRTDHWREDAWSYYREAPHLGGSEGRQAATAFGGAEILEAYTDYADLTLADLDVAIQGFGSVGANLAEFLHDRGVAVVAVSNSQGGIYDDAGIDIPPLVADYETSADLFEADADRISNDELLTLDVDVLIPAAVENQLTSENARDVEASAILEMANGPRTPPADRYFADRGLPIIPDILANAGGVTVSYFEWVQNTTNTYWTLDRIRDRLSEQLRKAFETVRDVKANEESRTWREATYIQSVDAVLQAEEYRSNLSR